jgi:hypothetical protein
MRKRSKNIIITATDSKYGDFLIGHWLRSLKANSDLDHVDVLILDYGLTSSQARILKKENIILKRCKRDGYVVNLRLRDIADFFSGHKYERAICIDSGDVIFQEDVSPLFDRCREDILVFREETNIINFNKWFASGSFSPLREEEIRESLKDKKTINCGVIIGPVRKLECLFKEAYSLIIDKEKYGADQLAINYLLYRDGFKPLEGRYNFILTTSASDFFIESRFSEWWMILATERTAIN